MTKMQFKCLLWPLVACVLRVSLWRLQQRSRDQKPLPSNKNQIFTLLRQSSCHVSHVFRFQTNYTQNYHEEPKFTLDCVR